MTNKYKQYILDYCKKQVIKNPKIEEEDDCTFFCWAGSPDYESLKVEFYLYDNPENGIIGDWLIVGKSYNIIDDGSFHNLKEIGKIMKEFLS